MSGRHRLDDGHDLMERSRPLAEAMMELRDAGRVPVSHHRQPLVEFLRLLSGGQDA